MSYESKMLEQYNMPARLKVEQALLHFYRDTEDVVKKYGEITEKELFEIIREDLGDFLMFCKHINTIIKNSEKFNLKAE